MSVDIIMNIRVIVTTTTTMDIRTGTATIIGSEGIKGKMGQTQAVKRFMGRQGLVNQ